ncbi:MAG: hypothetical protein ACFB9N_19070 [Geitlerinemataceae cyanobacterium]
MGCVPTIGRTFEANLVNLERRKNWRGAIAATNRQERVRAIAGIALDMASEPDNCVPEGSSLSVAAADRLFVRRV